MTIQRAWKYKLELTASQGETLWTWMSHLRGLFNLALQHREMNYRQFRKSMNYYDQANDLVELKSVAPWLANVPSQCLQQKLKDVETAYKRFFKKEAGYPQFKKRGKGMSLRFPEPKGFAVSFRKGKRTSFVKLPKVGLVKFVSSREMRGRICNATVTLNPSGEFYISFQTEQEIEVAPSALPAVGIDRGVRTMGMTSEGECLELPLGRFRELEKKLAKEQRVLARKTLGSHNYKKQKVRVAKCHAKIANVRKDSLHKITNGIAKSHGLVVLENLKIKNMTASASGTLEEPGKRVAQKRGLNKAILQQGWGEFARQLAYKLSWAGGELRKVPPQYTSQKCSNCGHVHSKNRRKERFLCLACGHADHADVNAAKNILALGYSVTVCGGASVGVLANAKTRRVSKKQKPVGGVSPSPNAA